MTRGQRIARGGPCTAGDGTAAARLFRPDRPRKIDRYIDYFGGAADAPGVAHRAAVVNQPAGTES